MSIIHKLINDDVKEWPAENQEAFFESLFQTYYKPLCKFSFRILRDKDIAEDVVQTCFVNLWKKKDATVLKTSFKSYLFRSVYNRSINEYARAKKYRNEDVSVLESVQTSRNEDPLLVLQAQDTQKKIDQAIAAMPDGCRTIFLMSREEQLSYKEIAELLEISVKTVENQLGKALRILREHLFILFIIFCISERLIIY